LAYRDRAVRAFWMLTAIESIDLALISVRSLNVTTQTTDRQQQHKSPPPPPTAHRPRMERTQQEPSTSAAGGGGGAAPATADPSTTPDGSGGGDDAGEGGQLWIEELQMQRDVAKGMANQVRRGGEKGRVCVLLSDPPAILPRTYTARQGPGDQEDAAGRAAGERRAALRCACACHRHHQFRTTMTMAMTFLPPSLIEPIEPTLARPTPIRPDPIDCLNSTPVLCLLFLCHRPNPLVPTQPRRRRGWPRRTGSTSPST
jgi:hypothetical protein